MLPSSPAMRNLDTALRDAIANRPATQGFPYLAETLRRAGVRTTTWWLPAMQSCYETELGPVVVQSPLPPCSTAWPTSRPSTTSPSWPRSTTIRLGRPPFRSSPRRHDGQGGWCAGWWPSMNARAHTSARVIRFTSNSMRPWTFRSGEGQREPLETATRGAGVRRHRQQGHHEADHGVDHAPRRRPIGGDAVVRREVRPPMS